MSKIVRSLAVLITAATIPAAEAAPREPARTYSPLMISIAARIKENGKLSREFRTFDLFCSDGECQLEVIFLNACDSHVTAGQPSFSPDTQRFSTGAGDLRVDHSGTLVIVEAKYQGHTIMNLRFGLTPDYQWVTSFTGTLIPDLAGLPSRLAEGVPAAMELIPFVGDFVRVDLDCPPRVRGLHKAK